MMLRIFQVETGEHRRHVRQLWWEYLDWVNSVFIRDYDISFDVETIIERDMVELGKFSPPDGRLFLAEQGDRIAGCASMRRIGEGVGEIKRMFVRPEHRGEGIGRSLMAEAMEQARRIGYSTMRLDSARFMKEAQTLYRSFGFRDIEPYAESEIPEEYRVHWVFMEMPLNEPSGRR